MKSIYYKHLAAILGLILITLAVYYSMVTAEAVFDDEGLTAGARGYYGSASPRMLTLWTYGLDGHDPQRLHATSIAVHVLASMAVYALVDTLVPSMAFWGALLFLVHPLFGVMGQYAAARSSGFVSLFIILAVTLALRVKSRWKWGGISLLAALAAISKEDAVFLLPILLALFAFEHSRLRVVVVMLCLVAGLFVIQTNFGGFQENAGGMVKAAGTDLELAGLIDAVPYPQYVLSMLTGYGFHILPNIFIPHSVTGDPKLDYSAFHASLALIVLCGLLWAFLGLKNKVLYVATSFLLFSPALARIFFKMHDASFEYRAYLSGAGFALIAAYALSRLTSQKIRLACACILTFAFMSYTVQRNEAWRTGKNFWEDVVRTNPSPRALTNLAVNYQRNQNFVAAIDTYKRAIAARYHLPTAHASLATAYIFTGRLEEARGELEIALKQSPNLEQAISNYAALLIELKQPELALVMADKAIAIDAKSALAYLNKAAALAHMNRLPEAYAARAMAEKLQKS